MNRAFTIESVSDMATPIPAAKGLRLELLASVASFAPAAAPLVQHAWAATGWMTTAIGHRCASPKAQVRG
jgi:hypothetical protein